MDELIERIAEEITAQIYNKVIDKLNAKFNLEDNTDDHDYIPFQNINADKRRDITEQLYSINAVTASDHTYQRAAERGINNETLQKLMYCTERNIIGLQNNGRLRVGIRDNDEVVVCICCVANGTATIITCWRTNIINYEKFDVQVPVESGKSVALDF